jgi:hypothetical protein
MVSLLFVWNSFWLPCEFRFSKKKCQKSVLWIEGKRKKGLEAKERKIYVCWGAGDDNNKRTTRERFSSWCCLNKSQKRSRSYCRWKELLNDFLIKCLNSFQCVVLVLKDPTADCCSIVIYFVIYFRLEYKFTFYDLAPSSGFLTIVWRTKVTHLLWRMCNECGFNGLGRILGSKPGWKVFRQLHHPSYERLRSHICSSIVQTKVSCQEKEKNCH